MGYAHAIEQQIEAARVFRSPNGLALFKHVFEGREGMQGVDISAIRDDVVSMLQHAEPFAVAAHLSDVLVEASSGIPDFRFFMNTTPCPDGWVYFEKPLPLVPVSGVQAIAWTATVSPTGIPALQLFFFSERINHHYSCVLPFWATTVHEGTPWREMAEGRNATQLLGFAIAFFEWIRQSVLVTSTRAISNRGVNKRIAAELKYEPVVRVVELRRREYPQHDEAHHASIEWSCQWLVRGHWRSQYFPASGEHRPLWINPHIKGPDDKPLRTSRTIAYEVVR